MYVKSENLIEFSDFECFSLINPGSGGGNLIRDLFLKNISAVFEWLVESISQVSPSWGRYLRLH